MRIKPFAALHPARELASSVAAVPYDTVETAEAARLASGNPNSFLHVTHSEIDLPPGTDMYSAPVYTKAVENFRRMQDAGVLVRDPEPALYVYRQDTGKHSQTGLVACCHIEDYEQNVVRQHERTRSDKEADRIRHIRALEANAGPIFLVHRDEPAVDGLVAAATQGSAMLDYASPDGIRHTVWRVPHPEGIMRAFDVVPLCYIADGHHRCAGAARVGAERRAANANHTGAEEYNWFLAVLFPASHLRIMAYNRIVHTLNGLSPARYLEEVSKRFTVRESRSTTPARARTVMTYLGGKWHELTWDDDGVGSRAERLDISVLQNRLLSPVLGIADPRTSKNITFVGGIHGAGELARRVDAGEAAVAFSMYPVSVADVMAVSDAGGIMPPKSTWFEPKLAEGLLIHTI